MTDYAKDIKEHMPVVCLDGTEFAKVDDLDGENSIKLTRDERGNHHWIPVSWVKSITDGAVHLDRSVTQVEEQWSDSNPADL